jgi:hypothetical protein
MPEHLTAWPRPYYDRPGGRPFLFYIVFGGFDADCEIGSHDYRTLGVHPGLKLSIYKREEHGIRTSTTCMLKSFGPKEITPDRTKIAS